MTNNLEKRELSNRIDHLREILITVGTQKGLNHPETIQKSQELDTLILEYQFMMIRGKK
ncbi:aspartyl-phosphate phosphatase Spo0E family protein [Bacillus sp. Gen3]|uniref:aspartyl-phosphate phosphatase Spo0E family protein n=1 Tax=Heyndrickxia oleronia TaxID=38875 RepID=UPI0015D0EB5F|nr:aspartyl-phosphate phosphatase Spo0E family protein [Bacillus sp. Gen3]